MSVSCPRSATPLNFETGVVVVRDGGGSMESDTGTATAQVVRVISIYATGWRSVWGRDDSHPQQHHLELGKLEEFYNLFREQLPKVLLPPRRHDPSAVTFTRSSQPTRPHCDTFTVTRAESWLFALPSDQVVAAIDIDFRGPPLNTDPMPTIDVLGHGAYAQFEINGKDVAAHIAELAREANAKNLDDNTPLPPERHQIVFASPLADAALPSEETIALIMYRSDPPYRPEFMKVRRPAGLNSGSSVCAVTPYVSMLYGHPNYVENSVFLTVVQAVGTAARFRQIWHRAHGRVRDFRYNGQEEDVGKQPKAAMEFLADELGNLELELSFSVEASADLGLLIPSLRIESFHRELYAAMELRERAETVSRMFSRLAASVRSELTAADIREREASEAARLRRDAAFTVLGFIAAPFTFLLGFFSINVAQVNGHWSIFNWHHYLMAYIAATVVALVPLVTFFVLNTRALGRNRADKRLREERIQAINSITP